MLLCRCALAARTTSTAAEDTGGAYQATTEQHWSAWQDLMRYRSTLAVFPTHAVPLHMPMACGLLTGVYHSACLPVPGAALRRWPMARSAELRLGCPLYLELPREANQWQVHGELQCNRQPCVII